MFHVSITRVILITRLYQSDWYDSFRILSRGGKHMKGKKMAVILHKQYSNAFSPTYLITFSMEHVPKFWLSKEIPAYNSIPFHAINLPPDWFCLWSHHVNLMMIYFDANELNEIMNQGNIGNAYKCDKLIYNHLTKLSHNYPSCHPSCLLLHIYNVIYICSHDSPIKIYTPVSGVSSPVENRSCPESLAVVPGVWYHTASTVKYFV